MTETDLIEELRQQKPKAQQMLIERYGRYVFAQIVRLVSIVENAEEFIRMFSSRCLEI